MQDKETGSVGSSDGLLQDARTSLSQSQKSWQAWLALGPPKDEALLNSYQQFSAAIEEQLSGLQKSQSIDVFLRCRCRRFKATSTITMPVFRLSANSGPSRGVSH